jgi:hypothetical protein
MIPIIMYIQILYSTFRQNRHKDRAFIGRRRI